MPRHRFIAVIVTAGSLGSLGLGVFGCANAEPETDGAVIGTADASVIPIDRKLVLAGERERSMPTEDEEELQVRLLRLEDDEPIAEASISFAIEGPLEDASLARLSASTDDAGRASNVVFSGLTNGRFTVRIESEGAEPILVSVSVSRRGFGAVLVEAPYGGRREVAQRILTIVRERGDDEDVSCDGLTPEPSDQTNRFPEGEGPISVLLPARSGYAFLAQAMGESDQVLASACADGVDVTADDTQRVALEFIDAPLERSGLFQARAELAQGAPSLSLVIADAFSARLDYPAAPSTAERLERDTAFLLDTLDKALRANPKGDPMADAGVAGDAGTDPDAGMDAGTDADMDAGVDAGLDAGDAGLDAGFAGPAVALADALQEALMADMLSGELGARLSAEAVGPGVATDGLCDYVTASLEAAQLTGRIDLSDERATWLPMQLRGAALSETGDKPTVLFDTQGERTSAELAYDVTSDQVTIEGLDVRWPWAELGSKALFQAASELSPPEGDPRDPSDLSLLMGCEALAGALDTLPLDTSACGPACITEVCDRALSTFLLAGQSALQAHQQTEVPGELSLRFTLVDRSNREDEPVPDDDLMPDSFAEGSFSARWEGDRDDASGPLVFVTGEGAP